MTTRRAPGDGGLYWDEPRQRWIAAATVGHDSRGKRIRCKASGRTKTEAKNALRAMIRDHEAGLTVAAGNYSVADATRDWLDHGLSGRSPDTITNYRHIAKNHITAPLGAQRLRNLSAVDVDRWLADEAKTVSTRTLRLMHSILNRVVRHAMARDKVARNVVELCEIPTGQKGRPSKSLSFDQADAVLTAAEGFPLHAYVVLSLLTGARTEELRALRWREVDLSGRPDLEPPVLPSIAVYRSVRVGGDTKTMRSRRRVALPERCTEALRQHHERLHADRTAPDALVFATRNGTELDAHNVRRDFRRILASAGLGPTEWTPRELRHSFVSLLSAHGVRIEDISRLVGHSGSSITEKVYRHQLHAVLDEGATAMNDVFPGSSARRPSVWPSAPDRGERPRSTPSPRKITKPPGLGPV